MTFGGPRADDVWEYEFVKIGIRLAIADERRPGGFRLRDGSFSGEGSNPELGWHEIRRMAY